MVLVVAGAIAIGVSGLLSSSQDIDGVNLFLFHQKSVGLCKKFKSREPTGSDCLVSEEWPLDSISSQAPPRHATSAQSRNYVNLNVDDVVVRFKYKPSGRLRH